MKVDLRDPAHWFYLITSGVWVAIAIVLRVFRRRGEGKCVLLYGHKLGGNLLALQRALQGLEDGPRSAFLTLDPAYHRELLGRGETSVLATSPDSIRWLISADGIISDHALHSLFPLVFFSSVKFFDVWHGIPFKGFDRDDFRLQHHYDEVWVASKSQRSLYINRFGFDPAKIQPTGYARTDRLVRRDMERRRITSELGIDPEASGKLILFAPTWRQDDHERAEFPFGVDAECFLSELSRLACRIGATVVVRSHLNSMALSIPTLDRVVSAPYAQFPDTEAILLASDILICDWSSIAFDFLLLDRPTIFLDVPPPFRKGYSLGPEYRYGPTVPDLETLLSTLSTFLKDPAAWDHQFEEATSRIREAVYGNSADGHATERCLARLKYHLGGW